MTSVMLLMEDYLGSYTNTVGAWLGDNEADYEAAARYAFSRSIYYGDAYQHAFTTAGVKARQVVPMCRPLQALWAREHGIPVPPPFLDRRPYRWPWTRTGRVSPGLAFRRAVLDSQIEEAKPDVLWVFSGIPVTAEQIDRWRASVGRVVLWWSCPLNSAMPYQRFDLILSCIPGLVDHFRSMGIRSEYMAHAFDARIHERVTPATAGRINRVAFVGNLSAAHRERIAFLDTLSREVEVDFFGSGEQLLPVDSPLRARRHAPVWGDDLYGVYGRYALAVHRNIGTAGTSASAKRLFEATGMGAGVITEADTWLPRLFEPGTEIAIYDSASSCADVVRRLLSNPAELESIAARGQDRTLRDHNYDARATQFLSLVAA